MSEKIDRRWRINSRAVLEVLYEGRWETAGTRWTYPDNGHNQRFAEAVADACGDIDALTSERDEAVRRAERAERLMGVLKDTLRSYNAMRRGFLYQQQRSDAAVRAREAYREALVLVRHLTAPDGMSLAYLGTNAGEDIADLHEMVSGILDSLTATGGLEPQKGITE